jgi:hypothetical protein
MKLSERIAFLAATTVLLSISAKAESVAGISANQHSLPSDAEIRQILFDRLRLSARA